MRIGMVAAAAVAALVAGAAITPRAAAACWTCDWQYGCTGAQGQGWTQCSGFGGGCTLSGVWCRGWLAWDAADVAPDGSPLAPAYGEAALAAASEPGGVARDCDGVVLARGYDPDTAAAMRRETGRISL